MNNHHKLIVYFVQGTSIIEGYSDGDERAITEWIEALATYFEFQSDDVSESLTERVNQSLLHWEYMVGTFLGVDCSVVIRRYYPDWCLQVRHSAASDLHQLNALVETLKVRFFSDPFCISIYDGAPTASGDSAWAISVEQDSWKLQRTDQPYSSEMLQIIGMKAELAMAKQNQVVRIGANGICFLR